MPHRGMSRLLFDNFRKQPTGMPWPSEPIRNSIKLKGNEPCCIGEITCGERQYTCGQQGRSQIP